MTVISDSQFRNPNQISNLPGYSSSRFLDTVPESVIISQVCQDSQNPSLVIIDFSVAGAYYFTPVINILDVDGDSTYSRNGVTAPLFLNDSRTSSIPINTNGGVSHGRVVADFGNVIPNFLYAQKINFELLMNGTVPVAYGVSFPAQSPKIGYLWEKGVLPSPVNITYKDGVIEVYFQNNGQVDCSCNIQCVEPSGVSTSLNICPNDTQSISVKQTLSGDPYTFNLLLRDAIGNLSELNVTTLTNVNPVNPIVALRRASKSGPIRAEIGIAKLSKNGVSITDSEYQIIKYTNSSHNYIIWKDWSERPWTNFIDYDIKLGNVYGYAVRYKGKFNDISNLSEWTTISTVDKIQPLPLPKNFGAWTRAWNHDSNETDATVAFPGMLGVLSNNNNKAFPDKFMAVHMSLIPKGPQRGSVIVWDRSVVAASIPAINADPLVYWSLQPWAIVDPSDTPSGYTHRNYLLPIGPVDFVSGVYYFPNIFCAGQTWSQNGDLIVGGGVRWDGRGLQYGDTRTFAWNPAVPTSFLSGPHKGPVTCQALDGGHYGADNEGYGAWVQGPDIGVLRYYPTLTLSPSISRQSGKPAALIFGGTVDLFNATLEGNSSWNSYESLIIYGQATSGDCGFYLDNYNGSSIFAGPSDLDDPYADSLYFYPRMIPLSNGSIFMAGFAPRSAALIDHDTQPGVWSITNGNTYVDGLINNQRYYGSAVLMPNIDGKEDNIIRIGGGLTLPGEDLTVWDTNTTEIIEATSTTSTDWRPGPTLNRVRSLGAVVVLPDASIMMFGGVDADENILPRMPHGRDTIVGQEEAHPLIAHDHHGEIIADTFAPQDEQMHEEEATNAVASAVGGIINGFQISHLAPEILFPGAKEWILMDWAPAKSTRNYHCSAVLLPDTRILVAGGEAREWDYEIFEPHYIRPGDGSTPNKPKNIVITDATIDTAKDHGAYDLSYDTEYTIECAELYPDRLGKIVLMSPGSFTHHNDMTQSYRELQVSLITRNKIKFRTPLNDKVWQKGFHMLFALSNQGIPANAIWIKFS